ncbi:hypothetical protein MCUN1_001399 [Malassezia cuniculi]|uniref:Pyridoxal phosphate homeostasis protein n=1 Tax=Malassezia cuniculi TaxID=948313 RepID=A0AAF0J5T4_9BASI|nr:hypothetical protein MCUN1_001399 [Malassezia cuniculi]
MYQPEVPAYTAAVQGSFAYDTTVHRWPTIITQVVDAIYRRSHELSANEALADEGRRIIEEIAGIKYAMSRDRPLEAINAAGTHAEPASTVYDEHISATKPSWFKSDWLFAECYLYRRLFHIFATSEHWSDFDPFAEGKIAALNASGAAIGACAELIENVIASNPAPYTADGALFADLASVSLWGNAIDLSLLTNASDSDIQKLQAVTREQRAAKADHVLVDDTSRAWERIRSLNNGRVDIVLDNAGFEVITDLLLADWLLSLRGPYPRASPQVASDIKSRIGAVRQRVEAAAKAASASTPRLVAVSKLHPPSSLMAAYEQTGQRHFGENYVQELADKANVLPRDIQWHFIGGLQSNKAKVLAAIPNLYAVESVDSQKLATNLEKGIAKAENKSARSGPLRVYIQINTSGETEKSGVPALAEASAEHELVALARHIVLSCPHLRLVGLMTIGALSNSKGSSEENPDFQALVDSRKNLLDVLLADASFVEATKNAELWHGSENITYDDLLAGNLELSMGMSADLEAAVRYGSTNVRIGSDCFGGRTTNAEAGGVRAEEIERVAKEPLVSSVVLHTKNMPWFVSDATNGDIDSVISSLSDPKFVPEAQQGAVKAMAQRWSEHLSSGRMRTSNDVFWTQPLSYGHLPSAAPDLLKELQKAGIVIFKGDLNYRKLTQDAQWPTTTTFEHALGPLAGKINIFALRTCKAEVCVGLLHGQEQKVDAVDPKWRVNGHWAIASYCGLREC